MYDVIQVADHFGVSRMAMIYRLKNIRLISQADLDNLKKQDEERYAQDMAELLGVRVQPASTEEGSAFRRRFVAAALEAYRRSLISQGKFAELGTMVDFTRDQLRTLQEMAGVSDDDERDLAAGARSSP
jgi:hypothetical protein